MAKPKIERLEAYKKYKMELHEAMLQKQRVPYSIKRKMSEDRIRSFYKEATARGYNCHVSVGGLDEEGRALGYKAPPDFKVSDKCCYYLKEAPCDIWAKENNSVPYLGIMASEGGRRADALEEHGCNYFGKTVIRSAPFAFYYHSDIVHLAVDLNVHIPEIYGEVKISDTPNEFGDYEYTTTGEQRTGCSMCGFGIQMETRPHRFDRLYERNPKEWDFWMNRCCTDSNGNKFGWGRVLDYVGIEWKDPEHWWLAPKQLDGQMTIFDYV